MNNKYSVLHSLMCVSGTAPIIIKFIFVASHVCFNNVNRKDLKLFVDKSPSIGNRRLFPKRKLLLRHFGNFGTSYTLIHVGLVEGEGKILCVLWSM